jgi:hypothetical protein
MPKRKDETSSSSIIRIRIPNDLLEDVEYARKSGGHNAEAQSTFLGYLVKLGLAKYNKIILPAEQGNDELATNGASAEVSADTIKAKGFKSSVKT